TESGNHGGVQPLHHPPHAGPISRAGAVRPLPLADGGPVPLRVPAVRHRPADVHWGHVRLARRAHRAGNGSPALPPNGAAGDAGGPARHTHPQPPPPGADAPRPARPTLLHQPGVRRRSRHGRSSLRAGAARHRRLSRWRRPVLLKPSGFIFCRGLAQPPAFLFRSFKVIVNADSPKLSYSSTTASYSLPRRETCILPLDFRARPALLTNSAITSCCNSWGTREAPRPAFPKLWNTIKSWPSYSSPTDCAPAWSASSSTRTICRNAL